MVIENFDKSLEQAKVISNIIRRCQMELMVNVYPRQCCEDFCKIMTPEKIISKNNDRKIFVYKKLNNNNEKEIIGCIGFKTINQPTPSTSEVKLFFVNPDYHKQGIATQLFNHVENIAKELNLTKLRVFSSLYANKFYEKMGFIPIKKVTRNFDNKIEWTDIYMEKEL